MSELTLFLIRIAYLAILWIFVLSAISVIRSDMFGARVPEAARGAEPKREKRSKAPPKRRGSPTHVLVVETVVASAFVVVAAVSVTGSAWLIVVGLADHGLKDFWQHRTQFVTNTRWWPPFCAGVDFVAAALIAVIITTDFSFPW